MKKIFVCQSNYIPWKGYFDAINMADVFVVYDDMQYTKNDWRNRNIIKTKEGLRWLTIPLEISGKHFCKINEMEVSDKYLLWGRKHWQSIIHNYSKATFFKEYKQVFEEMFEINGQRNLTAINVHFLKGICALLNIHTPFVLSSDLTFEGDRNQKLISICNQLQATEYLSGPAAKTYLNQDLFAHENIKVTWLNYENYPMYNQLHSPFTHAVSVIDLIFNCGLDYPKYMKSYQQF